MLEEIGADILPDWVLITIVACFVVLWGVSPALAAWRLEDLIQSETLWAILELH